MRDRFTKTGTCILLLLLLQFTTNAQQPKRLYIANDDHTDYMWTADSATYQTSFLNMLDWWMDYNDQTAAASSNPNFHSKFNCDGSFWIRNYQRFRSTTQFNRLLDQIRAGKITVPYSPLILTYGSMPAEAVIRSMYYAGELERNYNLDFDMAYAMENQTLPLGVASLWKGAGAKYSWHGICDCNTFVTGVTNRQKEIYWYKGLDSNKVLMKWYSMVVPGQSTDLGGYGEARDPLATVTNLDVKATTTNPAYPYEIAGGFGYGWDNLETTADVLVPAANAYSNASRQVIVSNEVDFFKDFESNYGATLDSLTQTYGNEWDLACASIAGVSGKIKRSLEKLRVAEAMAAIVSNYDNAFVGSLESLDSLKREAWLSLGLFWEHSLNFTSAVPFSDRFVFQNRLESVFSSYVDQLYTLAQSNLGNLITNSAPANTRFYVFNPLGWDRTDYADYAYTPSGPIRIMDVSTTPNTEVPFQIITKGGIQYIRVDAASIPSLGYRVFEIQPSAGTTFQDAATVDQANNIFENNYFKIVYTKQGVLTSILDKSHGNQELVAATGGKYVNDLGSGLNNVGAFSLENIGPVSVTIVAGGGSPLAHTTKITLYKNIPRIDIDNQITENFDGTNTWSYSFNITNPEIWHEETGAVIKAKLTSNGGNYATQNARYDWNTLNHFASVNEPSGYGVSISNEDCYFMKIGNSTPAFLDETSSQLNVLAGGRVVGFEGFPDQGDPSETMFNQRFAITTHASYSAASEMKKALEHQDPMVCGTVVSPVNFLLPNQFSFAYIADPDAVIWALKPAEGPFVDRGIVTRMWNLGNTDLPAATLHFHNSLPIAQAKRTTHVETDMNDAFFVTGSSDLLFPLGHNEMRTYRAKLNVIPLAIKPLVTLQGNKIQGSNVINWRVSNETNLKTYELERSINGQLFIGISSVAKAGTTAQYEYTDKNINNSTPYYYRLKVIDADNKFFYSNTILIKAATDPSGMMLFPNPVTDVLKVFFMLDKQTRCNVSVFSATGAVVKTVAPPLFERGNNYYMLSVKELPAGEYVFCVDTGDKKYVKSFIKK